MLFAVVVLAIATVEHAYAAEPVPPGADTAHWIVTSYSFIGRAHPSDFRVQPGVDPPMVFLAIGSVVLVVGSPLTTGFVFGGLLLLVYGLTTIHLARRFFRTPSAQLLFVGAAVLNGTVLQMLFWGGYPNFLGFSMVNEAMVFLLAFARARRLPEALGFFGFAALTYLTHSLTFTVFAVSAIVGLGLLLARDRTLIGLVRNRATWVGLGLFALLVGGYVALTDLAKIPHAGYLYTNPATFVVDPVGLLFRPFHFAPAYLPKGPSVVFDSEGFALAVVGSAVVALLIGAWAARARPRCVRPPLLLALSWAAAAIVIPAVGYLAHVDTDYPRFAYFLPLPIALFALLAGESALLPSETARPGETASSNVVPVGRVRRYAAWGGSGLAIILLLGLVTVPTVSSSEGQFTSASYDANFVSAVRYLGTDPTPGAVLTESTEATRWVEALATRNAFTTSPTWLQFYPTEILDNELSYWALNSQFAVSSGTAALEFSGPNATALDAYPAYVPYIEGIPFPAVRLALTGLSVSYQSPNGSSSTLAEPAWPAPSTFLDTGAPITSSEFRTSAFVWNSTASLAPNGSAVITIGVVPSAGIRLTEVTLALHSPVNTRLAGNPSFEGFEFSQGPSFSVTVSGPTGALPTPANVRVQGSLSIPPDPARSFVAPATNRSGLVLNFPAGPGDFRLSMGLSATGLSNPAVQLPPSFTTAQFLGANDIRYAMFQTIPQNEPTVSLFERDLGFALVYSNPEWEILRFGAP